MRDANALGSPIDPSNAKVYISNINKNISEETLRKKFEQFGPIRSCILKKKPNDVTYSFIQYERPADAAAAIAKLNDAEVWERNLKVQHGLGGKKGFQHYLTDAERDRKFGQSRKYREYNDDSMDRSRSRKHDKHKDRQKRRSRSRDSRQQRSYSPKKDQRRGSSPRRTERRKDRIRDRDSRERIRDYSYDSRDSYYRQRRHRERRDKERDRGYRGRDSRSRQKSSQSEGKRRRSREKPIRYDPLYAEDYLYEKGYERRSYERRRSPYKSRDRDESYRRYRQRSPQRRAPRDRPREYSRTPSQDRRRPKPSRYNEKYIAQKR